MPLNIIIVGAGIGGLSAAIAFTRAGHDVAVYEKSSFHNEVGAAIHLAPNATRVLKSWDCDFEAMQPSRCEGLDVWNSQGDFIVAAVRKKDVLETLGIDGDWLLVHRVDLHNYLRKKAEEGFNGKKPTIHLASALKSADPDTGKVVLEDGTELQADLIVGADGVHSRTVDDVTESPQTKVMTGQSCFRFLVPTAKAKGNPTTNALLEKIGLSSMHIFSGKKGQRLTMYPCRSGKLLNVGLFFVEGMNKDEAKSSWLNSGSHEDLMAQVKSWSNELRELCNMAEDLKLWSLDTRDPPRTFFRNKLVLTGDAAHPTLPHQGQGGAQAIEDAAALGALFLSDTKPEQITERLQMYNDIRYERTVTILFTSRVGVEDRAEVMGDLRRYVPDAKLPENSVLYAWDSYPVKAAEQALASAARPR